MVSEYKNMFDVVAMIPGVRRKPARLYCGGGVVQSCKAGWLSGKRMGLVVVAKNKNQSFAGAALQRRFSHTWPR